MIFIGTPKASWWREAYVNGSTVDLDRSTYVLQSTYVNLRSASTWLVDTDSDTVILIGDMWRWWSYVLRVTIQHITHLHPETWIIGETLLDVDLWFCDTDVSRECDRHDRRTPRRANWIREAICQVNFSQTRVCKSFSVSSNQYSFNLMIFFGKLTTKATVNHGSCKFFKKTNMDCKNRVKDVVKSWPCRFDWQLN